MWVGIDCSQFVTKKLRQNGFVLGRIQHYMQCALNVHVNLDLVDVFNIDQVISNHQPRACTLYMIRNLSMWLPQQQ